MLRRDFFKMLGALPFLGFLKGKDKCIPEQPVKTWTYNVSTFDGPTIWSVWDPSEIRSFTYSTEGKTGFLSINDIRKDVTRRTKE